MKQSIRQSATALVLLVVATFVAPFSAAGADTKYRQVADGIAVYFGIMPAELVRGHPSGHPERTMHGGPVAGENHLVVAVFNDRTGERLTGLTVSARIAGRGMPDARKPLEPMVMAGALSYGNYFNMPGTGPYRIEVEIVVPGRAKPVRAEFSWGRS